MADTSQISSYLECFCSGYHADSTMNFDLFQLWFEFSLHIVRRLWKCSQWLISNWSLSEMNHHHSRDRISDRWTLTFSSPYLSLYVCIGCETQQYPISSTVEWSFESRYIHTFNKTSHHIQMNQSNLFSPIIKN